MRLGRLAETPLPSLRRSCRATETLPGVFRQSVRRAQTNEHGVGSVDASSAPTLASEEGSPQSGNFLPCKTVNLGWPRRFCWQNRQSAQPWHPCCWHAFMEFAQQTYTILTEFEVVAQAGHSISRLLLLMCQRRRHLGGVLGKNEQFFLFDACRTCRCGNFSPAPWPSSVAGWTFPASLG